MNRGALYGIAAYTMWGIFPIYFKWIKVIPATQILAHRITGSFVLLIAILLIRKEWPVIKTAMRRPRIVAVYTIAAILLSINWLTFIWGVTAGFLVETSLGYFINPLVSVLLGVVFLRERLRPIQWAPIALAAIGVGYMTLSYGRLPWIALILAFSFGSYGLVKKMAPLNSLHGLSLETGILFLPAALFLGWADITRSGAISHGDPGIIGLLLLAGPMTTIPLLLFGAAVRSIPLSLLGLLQYIAPTLQFLLGVLVYAEPFDGARLIGFSMIWTALLLLWLEGMLAHRRKLRLAA